MLELLEVAIDLLFIDVVPDAFAVVFPAALIGLWFLGWKRDRKWARVSLILLVLITLIAFGLFAAYVAALGQANWSY